MLSNVTDISAIVAKDIMTADPKLIAANTLAIEGVKFIQEHKINHLVLTTEDKLVGFG